MRIGIATDYGRFGLKEELVAQLRTAGHEVVDFGANSLSPDDDYPDFVTHSAALSRRDTLNAASRSAAAVSGHQCVPTRFPACAPR
jgi:ribose 5-phosphate isomerase B